MKKIYFGVALILVILTASLVFYFTSQGNDFKVDIQNTRTQYYVNESGWVLAATEYVNLYDGTTKMRASSRNLTWYNDSNYVYAVRKSTWKDNITTIQTYTFKINENNIDNVPLKNEFQCENCVGKIVHYEIRDILYDGITKNINSPFSFGHKMNIEWKESYDFSWAKVYQQISSDKIIIRYKPKTNNETYYVRLFDPAPTYFIYDEINDSSINASLWSVGGTGSSSENADYLSIGSSSSEVGTYTVSSNNLVGLSLIRNITFRAFVAGVDANEGASGASGNGRLYIFGDNTMSASKGDPAGTGSVSDDSVWIVSRNLSAGINKFDIYDDGVYLSQITAANNVISLTAERTDGASGVYASGYMYYVYYWTIGSYPFIVLNTPVNNLNSSNSTINFNATVTDEQQVNNVTLYIDGILNETNTSQVNGTYIFTKILSEGNHNWSISAYNNYSNTNQSEARNLTTDYTKPIIKVFSPQNITYNLSGTTYFNATSNEHIDNWIVNYNGTNFTISPINTTLNLVDGNYHLFFYGNDSSGNTGVNDTIYFTVDAFPPKIEYSSDSMVNNTVTDNLIYINVTVSDVSETNITFNLYFSNKTIANSSTYTNLRRNISWLGFPDGEYFYNVTVFDDFNRENITGTRRIYLSDLFLFVDNSQANKSLEIGSVINITSNSSIDFGFICFDIDHPDYGNNYTCSNKSVSLNLTIDYFRKKILSDGLFSKMFNFLGGFQVDDENLTITSHQYDEVVGLAVNISSSDDAENVVFYGCNSSTFDRAYAGFLVGNNIYLNQSVDSSGLIFRDYENITFNNPGNQTIYFYLDDNATIRNITMSISSKEYGFSYFDEFDDFSYIDQDKSNIQLHYGSEGIIQAPNSSLQLKTVDDFNDASIADIWAYSATESGSGYSVGVRETGGYMEAYVQLGNPFEGEVSRTFYPYSDKLWVYTSDYLSFSIVSSSSGDEYAPMNDCHEYNKVLFGGTTIWQESTYSYTNEGEYESASLNFTLEKKNNTYWRYTISGIETKLLYEIADCDGLGDVLVTYNYTNGSFKVDYADEDCTDINGALSNSSLVLADETSPIISVISHFEIDDHGLYCSGSSYMRIDNLKNKMWYRGNGTLVSNNIFDSSSNIASSTLNYSAYGNGSYFDNYTFAAYLSADGGTNWESVANGVEHIFSNPGKDVRYKIIFNTTNPGYQNVTAFIDNITVETKGGNVSNLMFDFGNDGVFDYAINGNFTAENGSKTISLYGADISNSFDIKRALYEHTYKIPLRISSNSTGQLNIENFNITYDPNPVILNTTFIQDYLISYGSNYTNFTIPIGAINGSVNVSNIKFDYKGGNDTIRITTRDLLNTLNVTRYLIVYYSDFYKSLPYTWTENIFFLPRTNSSKNVSAYGQTTTKPLFNITSTNYGEKDLNLSIKVDESFSCLNLTWSNSSTKPSGNKINTTYQEIINGMGYLNNRSIWVWADLENCNASEQRILNPILNIESYCKDCLWG